MKADQALPPPKYLLALEMRAGLELALLVQSYLWLTTLPKGDGHPVLVMPGLAADDMSTRPLRAFLRERGHAAHGLKLGRNNGLTPGSAEAQLARLREVRHRYGRKVSLVGWSLGGVFARELAKRSPDDVRTVITLGSPLRGNARASNAWQLYEYLAGHTVEYVRGQIEDSLPPVPMTAIFSRSDGVVAWPCSMVPASDLTESVEVYASHLGLGVNPAALYVIGDRLAQPEGDWAPFDRGGCKSIFFPDPWRIETR